MFSSTFKYLIFILILFFNILSLILNDWKVKMKLTTTLYNYYIISIISFVE